MIEKARQIYFNYLSNTITGTEPIGVVLNENNGKGRVVFDLPVLLPKEKYLKLELLRTLPMRSRQTRARNIAISRRS
ncbi:MAG: Uncharacterised protein [Prochlorococcus marinus str. MIT 9313]|nr:MAG: Uncharacterised protein [Prochlorococcus marinus str. MIT 9313]